MIHQNNADVGCLVVGEYVEEADLPDGAAFHEGEVVRPRLAANHLDVWDNNENIIENLCRAVLRVIQQETHGPSRARMVESIVRLQAMKTLREVLRKPSPKGTGLHNSALQALAQLFPSTDKYLGNSLLDSLEVGKDPKGGRDPRPPMETRS